MDEKEELEMEIERLRNQLKNVESRLWEINRQEYCAKFLKK